jgi:hypothetical protein
VPDLGLLLCRSKGDGLTTTRDTGWRSVSFLFVRNTEVAETLTRRHRRIDRAAHDGASRVALRRGDSAISDFGPNA